MAGQGNHGHEAKSHIALIAGGLPIQDEKRWSKAVNSWGNSAVGLSVLPYAKEVLETNPDFVMSTEGRLFADKYRILDHIAQGDLASVYQAMDAESGEVCTLRLFNWEFSSDGSFLDLMKREALNVEKLRHPNIMPVGKIDQNRKGQIYAVREFMEGRNLEDVMRLEGTLTLRRACMIGRQVASALEAAHNAGIIHGDLKPSNVLLVEEEGGMEAVKVLGFGTFTLKQDRFMDLAHLALQEPASLIGSAQYISPEQAIGTEPEALDGRSDVYSLGAILYEMLSGQTPFRGASAMEILLDHLFDEPRPFREYPDLEIPEVVDALVMRTLAKQRKDRPSTATVLVDQLQPWQKKEASASRVPVRASGRDEEVIIAGASSAWEREPESRSPVAYRSAPEVDESAPTVSLPASANARKATDTGNAEQGSLWSTALSPPPELAEHMPESSSQAPPSKLPTVGPEERKPELPSPPATDSAEQHPLSAPPFVFTPPNQPESLPPAMQLPVLETKPKTGGPAETQPESPWSSFSAPEPIPSAAGVDFRAPAANAEFAPGGAAQSEGFWSSKPAINWDAKSPPSEFPGSTPPPSHDRDSEAERTPFMADLDNSPPEVAARIVQEPVPITEEFEGPPPASGNPEPSSADSGVFVADLGEQLPVEETAEPTPSVADINLGDTTDFGATDSPQTRVLRELSVSDLSAPGMDASPAAEKPRHSHSALVAAILVFLIAVAGVSGWLYYTGRSYWFQPQYVISRVSSLLWPQSSSPAAAPAHPSQAPVSPPGSASRSSSAEALSHASSAAAPPASTATPHSHAPSGSAGAAANNGPIQALKVPGPSEAVNRLPASQAHTKLRNPRPATEDSPAVEDAIRRGNYDFLLGKYDDAISVYDAALKQSPGNPRLLEEIARARRAKAAEAEFLGH
jgi:eukaryotic-like serine/threonine-protein kinase